MTGDEFKAAVAKFGEENLIGFIFDNTSRKLFTDHRFSMDEHYDEDLETLMFVTEHGSKTPFLTTKHIENVQTIMWAIPGKTKWELLDARYVSG